MKTLSFNSLLEEAEVPLKQTNLLRHQKKRPGLPTPYALWRDQRDEFDRFQSYQSPREQSYFSRPFWANFVVDLRGETLFAGLYVARLIGKVAEGITDPSTGMAPGADKDNPPSEPYDLYECVLDERLSEFVGRIVVDWGLAHRSWGQVAAKQDKPIIELRRKLEEDPFPGYLSFICSLSEVASLPVGWKNALKSVRGIYLLTCPKTHEQYVGGAFSEGGFLARWNDYSMTGHGGNLGLKSRDPSDYQVSILETVGSAATQDDIHRLETLWKLKLQSREMGLNKN